MKECSRCHEEKSFSDYSKFGKSNDGAQKYRPECKNCSKEFKNAYLTTPEHLELIRKLEESVGNQECQGCHFYKAFSDFSILRKKKVPTFEKTCKSCQQE